MSLQVLVHAKIIFQKIWKVLSFKITLQNGKKDNLLRKPFHGILPKFRPKRKRKNPICFRVDYTS